MRIPRTRGAISGLMLLALGAWGALVPLIGPSFDLTIGSDATWDMTRGRFWLSLLPGVVAALGGLMLLVSRNRPMAILGAQLGLAAGVWFIVGPTLSQLWSTSPGALGQAGFAAGDESRRVLEAMAYFYAVGAAITAFAALALGRLTLRSVRDVELEEAAVAPAPARRTGRFERDRDRETVAEPAAVGATAAPARDEGTFRGPVDREREATGVNPPRDDEGVVRGPVDRTRDTVEPTRRTTATRRNGGLLGRFRR